MCEYFPSAMDEDGVEDTPAENGMVNGNGHVDGSSETTQPKARMSYDDYHKMANLLIGHIAEEEEKEGKIGWVCWYDLKFLSRQLENNSYLKNCEFQCRLVLDEESLRRSSVVNWYLKLIEDEIETEEELAQKKYLVDKVLNRLIHHVSKNVSQIIGEWFFVQDSVNLNDRCCFFAVSGGRATPQVQDNAIQPREKHLVFFYNITTLKQNHTRRPRKIPVQDCMSLHAY